MSERYISITGLDQVIDEKTEHYKEWLVNGIINEREFNEKLSVLDSVRTWAMIQSSSLELINSVKSFESKEAHD